MISVESLSRLSLFRSEPAGVVGALARHGTEVTYAPNGVLFLAGSEPRGWYVVLEGFVRVVRGAGARQHVVHSEGPGGTLGEVPLYTGGRHPATAIAGEPTRCALFDRASLQAAIAEQPTIAFLLARRLALRVEHLVERLDERSARSVRQRLEDFLRSRKASSRDGAVSLGSTLQGVAEELGTVREVVSRELRAMARDGSVEPLGGGRYRLLAPGVARATKRGHRD